MEYTFKIGVGQFSPTLIHGEVNTAITAKNFGGFVLFLKNNRREEYAVDMRLVTANTPHTYHSGNRSYGKWIIETPENIRVVKRDFDTGNNAESMKNNDCLLRSSVAHRGCTFGFDFYKIDVVESDGQSYEKTEKLTSIEVAGFLADMGLERMLQHGFPANLPDIYPGFPHITSGWTRSNRFLEGTELHLYALRSLNDISCFIPFAATSSDEEEVTKKINHTGQIWVDYIRPIGDAKIPSQERRSSHR